VILPIPPRFEWLEVFALPLQFWWFFWWQFRKNSCNPRRPLIIHLLSITIGSYSIPMIRYAYCIMGEPVCIDYCTRRNTRDMYNQVVRLMPYNPPRSLVDQRLTKHGKFLTSEIIRICSFGLLAKVLRKGQREQRFVIYHYSRHILAAITSFESVRISL
jgi:hypothetical protein